MCAGQRFCNTNRTGHMFRQPHTDNHAGTETNARDQRAVGKENSADQLPARTHRAEHGNVASLFIHQHDQ